MNVVNFLMENQRVLLSEIKTIGASLYDSDLYSKIKKHIANFDLYETAENELFSAIQRFPNPELLNDFASGCEKSNQKIWALFDRLTDAALANDFGAIEKTYAELRHFVEMHVARTQVLLPVLKVWFQNHKLLSELGTKALRKYARFYEPLEKVQDVENYVVGGNRYNGGAVLRILAPV